MKKWRLGVMVLGLLILVALPVVGAKQLAGGWAAVEGRWAKWRGRGPQVEFGLEAYDLIKAEYWDEMTDDQLLELYRLALAKVSKKKQEVSRPGREGVKKLVQHSIEGLSESEANQLVARAVDMVLYNLRPPGRSRLYTQEREQELNNVVNNVDKTSNQYQELGVDETAGTKEIARVYREKKEKLEASNSAEARAELGRVERAYDTLRSEAGKKLYDQTGVEATISYKLVTPRILYLQIKKFSPTTVRELARVTREVDKGEELNSLILDLRGNIGGAIDGLPYILGPFIGPQTLAYQYYHQGKLEDYYTKTGWLNSLVRYKKVVILVDGQTQSSAEVMTASLKAHGVGTVVGVATKGWGTIEKVYLLKHQLSARERYSVFLVHRLTVRDDGQPIEGRGVEPDINVAKAGWKEKMKESYSAEMVREVSKLVEKE